jgi:hypothetical protein
MRASQLRGVGLSSSSCVLPLPPDGGKFNATMLTRNKAHSAIAPTVILRVHFTSLL